ncbi:MAG TPA: hypothetical protein VGJ37_12640 [Pyrinomonadaceae bacterium]|jgi:hypothetical protein
MAEQPHFDDELTVLTAQQVVPLRQIDAKVKHHRRWFLGGAFAIAMVLGAASALLSAYFKLRNVPDPEIQSLSVSSVSEESPELPVVEIMPQHLKPKARNTDKKEATQSVPAIDPQLSDDEALRRIRDAVLVDEWQERRARRVERRERRNAQHRNRDLSNINEIFEGVRHP